MKKAALRAVEAFRKEFAREPAGVVFAPGRVNIIGEHTDYNEGFVLPAAVNLATYIAFAPSGEGVWRICAESAGECAEFTLDEAAGEGLAYWARYAWGTGMSLVESGVEVEGIDGYAVSTVPLGGGLSSSASFEVALALAYLGGRTDIVEKGELVRVCRRAENHFVGVSCGVMDQFASVFGKEGRALLLDCRSLEARDVPFPPDKALVVSDTTVRHALGEETEGYHKRQEECREAVAVLARFEKDVTSLRDATLEMLTRHGEALGDVLFRRGRHVVSENRRVLDAAEAIASGDAAKFGALMAASHASLRDDYEVSCGELDAMVEAAEGLEGHYGTRMTGGGFGGCTVSLVDADSRKSFSSELFRRYQEATGLRAGIHTVTPGSGAGALQGSWLWT